MIKRFSVCLAIVFVCSAAIPALAQNAALVGTVRDAQQALIPDVMVTLQNPDTGVELTTMTNELGNYEFPTVRPAVIRSALNFPASEGSSRTWRLP